MFHTTHVTGNELAADVFMDESLVEGMVEFLDAAGFRYDEDYETLYGAQWRFAGIRVRTRAVLTKLLEGLTPVTG